ncbi:hypothetical protein U9M48_016408 [Paspalum notatum var. saurae]|uniref:Transposase-associated domain-containing protein n=1 Tax=Paspalum notatum var. saurae TaxID=547442 RepID=A0AAQ3WN46_PASNO
MAAVDLAWCYLRWQREPTELLHGELEVAMAVLVGEGEGGRGGRQGAEGSMEQDRATLKSPFDLPLAVYYATMEDRGWMYLGIQTCNEYLSGLKSFIRAAEEDMVNHHKSAIYYPCLDCLNKRKFSSSMTVHAHLIICGFMEDYKCWNKHGEEGLNDRDLLDDEDCCKENRSGIHTVGSQDDGQYTGLDGTDSQTNVDDLSDEDILTFGQSAAYLSANLEEMLLDAVGVGEYTDVQFKKLKKLVESMETPLYPGCKEKWTKLLGSLKLLQLKATHHWTDRSFKALCELLCDMLPKGNEIPKTTYEAEQNIAPLGLEGEKIPACKNDCILFCGDDYADLIECPECGTPRYKRRKDGGDEDNLHGLLKRWHGIFPYLLA